MCIYSSRYSSFLGSNLNEKNLDENKNRKQNTKTIFVICLFCGPKGSPACLAWGGAAWKKARLEWAAQEEE
jgi:hypothetical protein